ncbi:MAG: hypothetical protein E7504_02805 [Ruminococcus sp.]|nr:hypothetical protein [Ruminococcus sp.]
MKKRLTALSLVLVMIGNIFLFNNVGAVFIPLIVVAENTTRDDADIIELNTSYEDSLISSDDINWYKFKTNTDGTITIDFSREVWGSDTTYWKLTLYYFDENLKEVSSSSFDGNHILSSTEDIGLPSGEYYIAIERYPYNFSNKTYSFSVNFTPSDNWEKELNNTFQTSTKIELNKNYSASLSSSDDCDWYQFSVSDNGYVSINFKREVFNDKTTYWKSTIYSIEDSMREMASWSYDGNHAQSTSPMIGLMTGDYYIKIERYPYNHSSRTYTINVNYKSSNYWEKEFNSTFQTASPLNLNTDYQGSLYSSSDVDWYSFSTLNNGYVMIDFEREVMYDKTTYWKMTLYSLDESLNEVASWSFDGNHSKSSTPEIGIPSGDYYFKIERYPYNYSEETYTIRVDYKETEYWEKEFNNSFQTSNDIKINKPYKGSLYSSNDSDWYSFELKQDSQIEFNFTTDLIGDNTNYWKLFLYQRTDTIDEMKSWNISGKSSVTTVSDLQLETGIYYLKVVYYSYNYNPTTYQLFVSDGTADEKIIGDVNVDGVFNVADVVALQKWLICTPNAVLTDWQAADMCDDEIIDVFDLCLMKCELLKKEIRG